MIIRHTGENLKMKSWKEPYPKNLILTIQVTSAREIQLPVDDITDDVKAGLDYALSTLSEREQKILRLRYQERLSLREIGVEIGVTTECVRGLEAKILRKLRHPRILGNIKYGKCGFEAFLAQREAEKAEEKRQAEASYELFLQTTTLEQLDLTIRSFNCLKKRGCDTLGDVAKLTKEEIANTKGLGKKSILEIAEKLRSIGVRNTAWDRYI